MPPLPALGERLLAAACQVLRGDRQRPLRSVDREVAGWNSSGRPHSQIFARAGCAEHSAPSWLFYGVREDRFIRIFSKRSQLSVR
jgi:hypothetical protein